MPAHATLQVLLQPNGRILTMPGTDDPEARWHVVGGTSEGGIAVSFVQAEISGASWAATVPSASLAPGRGAMVTLSRQTPDDQVPLVGWARFC